MNAQLKLNIQLKKNIVVNDNIYEKNIIEITISNNSSDAVAFPLNIEGLTPFFEGETCIKKHAVSDSYSLLPIILVTTQNRLIDAERAFHHLNPVVGNKSLEKKSNIYSKLIFLKPYQKYVYQLYFNPHEFHDDIYKVFYWYYQTQRNIDYVLSLRFCINKEIYEKLSKSERKKISKYKLFNGILISNNITYTEDINYGEE